MHFAKSKSGEKTFLIRVLRRKAAQRPSCVNLFVECTNVFIGQPLGSADLDVGHSDDSSQARHHPIKDFFSRDAALPERFCTILAA